MWQLETQLFASPYIQPVYIFKASYRTLVMWVSKKSNVNQSELEKQLVSDCKTNYIHCEKLQTSMLLDVNS